jgi:hypothetical protein
MSIASGQVTFAALNGSSHQIVWTTRVDTGGTDFLLQSIYACNDYLNYDYTDYEEVYQTSGPVPPYDFFFQANTANASPVTDWVSFASSAVPTSIIVSHSGSNVTIANEPYYLAFAPGFGDSVTVEVTSSPRQYNSNISIVNFGSNSPVDLSGSSYQFVSYFGTGVLTSANWTVRLSPSQGSPSFAAEIFFSFSNTTANGTYYLFISGADQDGSYNRIALSVNVLPILTVSASAYPGSGGIDVGQSLTFSANMVGGSNYYNVDWTALPSGCTVTTTPSVHCTPSSSGNFSIALTVTDSLGYTAVGRSTYIVDTDPTVTVSVTPGSVLQLGDVTFTANVSGGAGGLTYLWSGLPSGCSAPTGATLTCSPSDSGTYVVTLTAIDYNGASSTSSTNLTVNPAFLGLPALEGYALFLVVPILILLAIVLVVVTRRRKKSGQTTFAEGMPGVGGQPNQSSLGPNNDGGGPGPIAGGRAVGGVPSEAGVSPDYFEPSASKTEGLDPGSVSMGTPLINPPNPVCWHCHFENQPGSRYCAQCALPLEPPPPSTGT